MRAQTANEIPPPLDVSTETVCFLIAKARELHAKDAATIPDTASNPADDGMRTVLEDRPDDAVDKEIAAFIDRLNPDEQHALVSLYWLGRGDGGLGDWPELRHEAARAGHERTADYLLGEPLLADFLEEGLAMFGRSCRGAGADRP